MSVANKYELVIIVTDELCAGIEPLTTKQLRDYHKNGFVVIPGVFSQERCKLLYDKVQEYSTAPIGTMRIGLEPGRSPSDGINSVRKISGLVQNDTEFHELVGFCH